MKLLSFWSAWWPTSPDDPDLVLMLARTYIDAEDAEGAERATDMLIKHDAANYSQLFEVAKLYLKRVKLTKRREFWPVSLSSCLRS